MGALILLLGARAAAHAAALDPPDARCGGPDLTTKTPYWSPPAERPAGGPPPACAAAQLQLLARHGSRHPTKVKTCIKLERRISEHEGALRQLPAGAAGAGLRRWRCDYGENDAGHRVGTLTHRGHAELYSLGRRMALRFPGLFGVLAPALVRLSASAKERALQSAAAFAIGIGEGRPGGVGPAAVHPLPVVSTPAATDTQLRFHDNCPRHAAAVQTGAAAQQQRLFAEANLTALAARVTRRLGLSGHWELTAEDVELLYKECIFQHLLDTDSEGGAGASGEGDSALCAGFDETDFEELAYADDLRSYWKLGHGAALAPRLACGLLGSMLDRLAAHANGSSPLQVDARFAHAETLLPLVALLGLREDAPGLSWQTTAEAALGRHWRQSHVAPMGANLGLVLHYCGDGHAERWRVGLLLNEQWESWPLGSCEGAALCPLSALLEAYKERLGGCDVPKMCEATL
eukprot:TRINITY_DN21359_c0_g1_i1.p1 TRINITY_DN21359_c0_g1~~TRINITY_DN21359_c0_g1_i1.p1  ORF type:complete len:484 (+),score=124.07 TRINITY_DN21359_c0_g1_i1:67-1452(+)